MKIVDFKGSNTVFGADQPQYLPLPAFRSMDDEGAVISCWKPTIKERFKILFGANLWLTLLTFGNSIQPQLLEVRKSLLK